VVLKEELIHLMDGQGMGLQILAVAELVMD
jgi:hypothetical protein